VPSCLTLLLCSVAFAQVQLPSQVTLRADALTDGDVLVYDATRHAFVVDHPRHALTQNLGGSGVIDVSAAPYNARLDGVVGTDGAITSSSTSFTSASTTFTANDVGKVMVVNGAGGTGAPLVSTISSITSAHVVVLADAASTTVASGGLFCYGTDDTRAWQAALDAAYTLYSDVSIASAKIVAPMGISIVNGALQDTSSANAQLKITPILGHPSTPGACRSLTIEGTGSPGDGEWALTGEIRANGGTTIFSTYSSTAALSGTTQPAVMASLPSGGTSDFSLVKLAMRNIRIRVIDGAPLHGLNWVFGGNLTMDDCAFDTFGKVRTLSAPKSGSIALLTPTSGANALCDLRRCFFSGFDQGVILAETAFVDNCWFQLLKRPIYCTIGGHGIHMTRILVQDCGRIIDANATPASGGALTVDKLDVERITYVNGDALAWSNVASYEFRGDGCTGFINYLIVDYNANTDTTTKGAPLKVYGSASDVSLRNLFRTSQEKSVYAAGTAYSVTNAQAAVDFGTTDPSLTLSDPGVYLIRARLVVNYNAATFAAVRNLTVKLRRTNNTAADLTGASTTVQTDIVTTKTATMLVIDLPAVVYKTSNPDDAIALYAGLDTAPDAGSLDIVEASIVAMQR
jgi:alpha-D-ribose 1-methylphosphonate 5-triphosphate synthase subunit PhnG